MAYVIRKLNDNLLNDLADHAVFVYFRQADGVDFVMQIFAMDVDLNIIGRVAGEEFSLGFLKKDGMGGADILL